MSTYDLFLSGPMTGESDWGRGAFHEAAVILRQHGYKVFNPAESFGGDVTRPREDYMRVCLDALLDCDALVSLPRWSSSKGAHLERQVAIEIGLPVANLQTFLKGLPG